MQFSLNSIAKTVPYIAKRTNAIKASKFSSIHYDSRKITEGEQVLFVALKGENRDGHQYIEQAWRKGVRNFLVSDSANIPIDSNYLQVENTLDALQNWATQYRDAFASTLIALAGSNGKTTVKEWLARLLEDEIAVYKSPQSYNSQLGVALSLLGMKEADVAIIEAGVSQKGEMNRLKKMIRPQWGVFTHFGEAHESGFDSPEEKLQEKLNLMTECEHIFCIADQAEVLAAIQKLNIPYSTVGQTKTADLTYEKSLQNEGQLLTFYEGKQKREVWIPVQGDAAAENVALSILVARRLNISWQHIQKRTKMLRSISMRMEIISDNPEITIINDSYTADVDVMDNAFSLLKNFQNQPTKKVILADFATATLSQHRKILQKAIRLFGENNLSLIGPQYAKAAQKNPRIKVYADTETFLQQFNYEEFQQTTVLLKGARKFGLEQIVPYLSRTGNATVFKINLDKLSHNLRYFRSIIKPETRIMAMIKAFGYGSGSWEIARQLEQDGVDYFAVANIYEGIQLRAKGITAPIMITNPNPDAIMQLFRFNLEPEIYDFESLAHYIEEGSRRTEGILPLHLKIDTGMHRLGFQMEELTQLKKELERHPQLKIRSIFSHLASAPDPEQDAYTQTQLAEFQKACQILDPSHQALRHILNTAGILRFREAAQYDMVRVGIGLYGVSPLENPVFELEEIGSLQTKISRIATYPAGAKIGYGCSETLSRESRIATLPVGYADGIPRSLGNGKASFLLHGKRVPTVGRICMDMLMIDITAVPEALVGEQVILFGKQKGKKLSVNTLAAAADTISYEILTGISRRVRRIYIRA